MTARRDGAVARITALLVMSPWAVSTVLAQPATTSGLVAATTTTAAVAPPSSEIPEAVAEVYKGRLRYMTKGLEWLSEAARADDYAESDGGRTLGPDDSLTTRLLSYARRDEGVTSVPRTVLGGGESAARPTGVLSGRTVFLMAGHGWTYNDKTQRWYTQRGPGLGMVEDHGNLDQMHLFAHLLWNTGATVVPLRPIDNQPVERIVDNSSRQSRFFGPWRRSRSTVYHGTPDDPTPAMFATASREETAVARFQPYIPEAGKYPVYAWARDGRDRVNQLYRVRHAGGTALVRVDHRKVGKGWVWLGTHWFDRGGQGFVEVSNQVDDPYEADGAHVAVADAIRFGNGMGDARREGGRSGYTREDEGDCYWIERSVGYTAPRQLYTAAREDGDATVRSPPRTSAYMNRESEGRYFDRVLISFHSNASGGRGTVGLYNRTLAQTPDHQQLLAELTGRAINEDMTAAPTLPDTAWTSRTRHTYNGSNFGELRKDSIQNEMCATIVETAFHDHPLDAKFLVDGPSRMAMARSTLRGLARWFAAVGGTGNLAPAAAARRVVPLPPTPPRAVRAMAGPTTGSLVVSWSTGPADRTLGDAATDFRVLVSSDGRAFDAGTATDGKTSLTLTRPPDSSESTAPVFVRVVATNAAGWSLPCPALAVSGMGNDRGRILMVDGFTDRDSRLNPRTRSKTDDPTGPSGWEVQRVRPRPMDSGEGIVRIAEALRANGRTFDSCHTAAFAAGSVPTDGYSAVIWLAGRQKSVGGPGGFAEGARRLDAFAKRGGCVILSGSELAAMSEAHAAKEHVSWSDLATSAPGFSGSETVSFLGGLTLRLEPSGRAGRLPEPLPAVPFAMSPTGSAMATFGWPGSGAAIVRRGGVAMAAFPLESLATADDRSRAVAMILDAVGG